MSTDKRPELKWTRNYNLFEAHKNNRQMHPDPILQESLVRDGWWPSDPLSCFRNEGGKLTVLKGHHRLKLAEKLGVEVCYVVEEKERSLYARETARSRWSVEDHVYSRARKGEPEYRALWAFKNKHKLPLGVASSLFAGQSAGGNNAGKSLRLGTFQRGDQAHANQVLAVLDACDASRLSFSRSSSFVKAVSYSLRIPEVQLDRFLKRIQTNGAMLRKRATHQDYLEEISELYNRGSRERINIRDRANAVAHERKETFGGHHPAAVKE